MLVIDYAPYFEGKKFIGSAPKNLYRSDESTLEAAVAYMSQSLTAVSNISGTEDFKLFSSSEPDLLNKGIDPLQLEEYYYALKLGFCTPAVPAKTIFLAQKVLQQFGSLNYLTCVLPKRVSNVMFSKGHVAEGYTLREVLREFVDPEFEPLSDVRLKVKHADFYDVFLEDRNNVILVPNEIGELLSDSDIASLKYNGSDVVVGDRPIRFLANHYGAVDNVYDYRRLI